MSTIHRTLAAGAIAMAVAVPGGSAYALGTSTTSAAQTSRFAQVQQKVEAALAARQQTLAKLTTSVQDNKHLTSDHGSTLQNLLAGETSGINALAAKVPSDTTLAELRQDAQAMVTQYRVYLVMAPQVHLTEAADTQAQVETKVTGLEPRIQQVIAAAAGRGENVQAAQQAYNDLVTQVQNATTATQAADIAAVLAVTPAGYPADGGPLATARTQLHTAQADLKTARHDLQVIHDTLKDRGGNPNPGTPQGPATSTTA